MERKATMGKKTTLAASALLLVICGVSFGDITLYTPPAGDAVYAWNSRHVSAGHFTTGGNTMNVYLYFGGQYGNDHTVSIFEVPISPLVGETVTSAVLQVDVASTFDTGYYYGSARIGWLDTGTKSLTGDVVADGLGSTSTPGGPQIYDTYNLPSTLGTKSFDFTTEVQADLDAGRSYSTFVMSGSRETWGSIYTAESGFGPRIFAATTSSDSGLGEPIATPVPGSVSLAALGLLLVNRLKRRKADCPI